LPCCEALPAASRPSTTTPTISSGPRIPSHAPSVKLQIKQQRVEGEAKTKIKRKERGRERKRPREGEENHKRRETASKPLSMPLLGLC